MKTKVITFNNLPYEERHKILFYILKFQIRTLNQTISLLNNSIGDYQKNKIKEWIKKFEKDLNKYEEITDEQLRKN